MVQEKVYFSRLANGYYAVVPTAEVVVSLQYNTDMLKKKASVLRLSEKNGDRIPC